MADLNSRIEAAKAQVASLQGRIDESLQSNRTGGMPRSSATLATIRTPPAIKCRRVLKGHFGKITALHWSGDSTSVVSASQDGNLLVWNAVTANKLQSISLKSAYVMSVGMEQSKGNMVACGGLDNLCTVYRLDNPSQTVPVEMASHDVFLSCCRFLSEQHILTSSGDSTCIRWDISRCRVLDTFAEHKADAMFLSVRDANTFCSASVDKTIKLWDIRTPKSSVQTLTGHEGDVNGVDFMPSNSNALCSCSEDGTVRLWDLRAYQEVGRFGQVHPTDGPMPSSTDGFTSIAFSKSGRLIFCGHSEGAVVAYDVLSERSTPAFTLAQAHESHVSCIGVSPNGDGLCTGSWDFNLKIWA